MNAATEKYVYFLLAGAGGAIALVINQTHDAKLSSSHALLGIAVLLWGLSFIFGCKHLAYVRSNLFANFDLLKVEGGQHPQTGNNLQMMQIASEGIRSAMEYNSNKSAMFARLQFQCLVAGAIAFVGWHTYMMYLRAAA